MSQNRAVPLGLLRDMKRLQKPDFERTDLLPPRLEDWAPPHHPVRFVRSFVQELDLEALGFKMPSNEQGGSVLDPACLLSVWLFCWMERIRSLRQMERACLQLLPVMWLCGGLSPDKNSLWRFFLANRVPLRKLLSVQVRLAASAGMVGWALHALDGTKLQAASSGETALWRKRLEDKLKRLEHLTDLELARLEADARQDVEPSFAIPEHFQSPQAQQAFVRAFLQRKLATFDHTDRTVLHPDEPEACGVKARSFAGLGYNPQILVDAQSDLVVTTDVVASSNDVEQLAPMLCKLHEEQGRVADATVADKGYDSTEQMARAEEQGFNAIVSLKLDPNPFAKNRFEYDPERNEYICPQKRRLPLLAQHRPTKDKPAGRALYRCDPKGCPVRAQCTKSPSGRTVYRYGNEAVRERMATKTSSVEGKALLRRRKEVVEHKFGQLKQNEGFRRFHRRGLENVKTEWSLACCASNVWKIYRKKEAERKAGEKAA